MQFGRYKVLSQLGQGGMATVYLAEDPSLKRLVAVKIIHSHLMDNTNLLERFSTEAKTIAVLRSPNIVEIFDYGTEEDTPYLVMEYMDGASLHFLCSILNGQCLPQEFCAAIICQAAEGLAAAQKRGVVHRDIKPENLMFNSDGFLKIADFGIAHLVNEQSMTASGAILGSPNFMAPEQIEGHKPTVQADMWALGAVLYYCLSGKLPFGGPTITATMRAICDHPHTSILKHIKGLDAHLAGIVNTLLNKDPAARGDGPKWLANEMKSYLTGHNIIDLQDYVRSFIQKLEFPQGQTIAENTPTPGSLSLRSSHLIPSSQIRDMAGTNFQSTGLADADAAQRNLSGVSVPAYKNPIVYIGVFLIIMLLTLSGILWKGFWGKAEKPNPVSGVILSARSVTLKVGDTKKIHSTVLPPTASQAVTWKSTDSLVAIVNNGTIKAIMPGSAIIISTSIQHPAQAATTGITVIPKPLPEKVSPPPQARLVRPPKPAAHQAKPPEPTPSSQPALPAQLKVISAPPFAAIIVNGNPWGETPMTQYRQVEPGKYRIELLHRHYAPVDTTIIIKSGASKTIKFILK